MRRKYLQQKGFTLIEVLIAMSIFVIFIGVLLGSYTTIVRGQRDANNYRVLYSEARRVFDKITEEVRDKAIYYIPDNISRYQNAEKDLVLVAKDGEDIVRFFYDEKNYGLKFARYDENNDPLEEFYLNSPDNVKITKLNFYVSPVVDPYDKDNVFINSIQFQPKVTVYAEFEKGKVTGEDTYKIDLQTTISSRFYSATPPRKEFPYESIVGPKIYDLDIELVNPALPNELTNINEFFLDQN